jgi:hypothetical protein
MLGFQQKHIQACCSSNLLRQLQLSQIWHTNFYPEAAAEPYSRGYGATAARLTPDQKVGSLNLSALIVDSKTHEIARENILVINAAKAWSFIHTFGKHDPNHCPHLEPLPMSANWVKKHMICMSQTTAS